MTTRSDIVVDFLQSPRIAEIAEPSTALNMQDTVDTLRKQEDGFTTGLAFDKLLNASGKEDLGGGVSVGITVALQNTKVSFEARRTPAESGTVTTGSGTPIQSILGSAYTFVDSTADFVAAGVAPGSMVINFTDQSIADVTFVDDLNTLTTKVLVNGTANTFQIGDVYQVFNIIQCDLDGGNLVAVDEFDTSFSAVLPTAFTQIVRTSASSATLSEQQDIQFSSFGGGVTVDLTSLNSGVIFPTGTPRLPVNNWTDALTIANVRGFTQFFVLGDAVITGALDFTGFTFVGESQNKTLFTIDSSANVTNSEFLTATITGTLDGGNVIDNCQIMTLNFVEGFIQSCVLNGPITLSGTDDAHFLDCWSGIPGSSTPTIDFGGSGSGLSLRNYNGGIRLINKSGAGDAASLDMASGQIILDNTVTAGEIILRGVGKWANEETYSGGANITSELVTSGDTQHASFDGGVWLDAVNGVAGTTHPRGATRLPVNNVPDVIAVAIKHSFEKIFVEGNVTFDTGDDLTDRIIIGHNAAVSTITVNAGAITTNTEFRECTLTGVLDGNNIVRNCVASNVSGFSGVMFNTMIMGTTTLANGAMSSFLDCYSGAAGTTTPIIDVGSQAIIMRGYSGGIELTNKTGLDGASIDVQGQVVIADSNTTGIITIRGVGKWTNESTYIGTTTINNDMLSEDGVVATLDANTYDGKAFSEIIPDLLSMANGKIVEGPTGTFTFYEQDNITSRFVLIKTTSERNRQ